MEHGRASASKRKERVDERMKGIILAATKGAYLDPLTEGKPKAMIKILGKPLVQHTIEAIRDVGIHELIVVIGYQGDQVVEELGTGEAIGVSLTYVKQEAPEGVGNAVLTAKKALIGEDRFILAYSDVIITPEMIERLINVSDQEGGEMTFSITLTPETSHSGVVYRDEEGCVTRTVENPLPGTEKSYYVLSGLYLLGPSILNQLEQTPVFPTAIHEVIRAEEKIYTSVWEKHWAHIRYPWDLFEMNRLLLDRIQETRIHRTAKVEPNVSIEHPVVIDSGAIIRPGATLRGPSYIGPNAYIGNNCLIREYTNLEENVQIGFSSEIKKSLVMENTKIGSLSYIGDSLIGMNSELTAGITTMNVSIPPAPLVVTINGEEYQPNLKKLGAIVGNGTRISANVSTYPGVIIGANAQIGPGTTISRNIPPNEEVHANPRKKEERERV